MSDPSLPPSSTFDYFRPVEVLVVRPPRRRYWLHALLFLATVFTTLVVGARLQHNFTANLPAFSLEASLFPWGWILASPRRLLMGLPFCLTLMGILLAHEMGHYLYCVRYRVYATLPYFIPAPTLIGTLGAFIRIRSPIRSRAALFDIGIAGPIAGFVLALPVLAWGLLHSKPMPGNLPPSDIQFGYPLVFHAVQQLIGMVPGYLHVARWDLHHVYLHPVAVAAWVGMFATSLNLLPGGQLDGGHIIYSLAPRLHRLISRTTVLLLVLMTVFWFGWLVWSVLLLFTGMRHPQVPEWPGLTRGRYWLALFGLLMLLLTFVPAPFREAGLSSIR